LHYKVASSHNVSSVCRLSMTRVYCDKTAEARIMRFHWKVAHWLSMFHSWFDDEIRRKFRQVGVSKLKGRKIYELRYNHVYFFTYRGLECDTCVVGPADRRRSWWLWSAKTPWTVPSDATVPRRLTTLRPPRTGSNGKLRARNRFNRMPATSTPSSSRVQQTTEWVALRRSHGEQSQQQWAGQCRCPQPAVAASAG